MKRSIQKSTSVWWEGVCCCDCLWILCWWRLFSEPPLLQLAPLHASASAWLLQIVTLTCPCCSSDLCSPLSSLFSSTSLKLGASPYLCVFLTLSFSGRPPLPSAAFSEVALPSSWWRTSGGPVTVCHFGSAQCLWWRAATAWAVSWSDSEPGWTRRVNLSVSFTRVLAVS